MYLLLHTITLCRWLCIKNTKQFEAVGVTFSFVYKMVAHLWVYVIQILAGKISRWSVSCVWMLNPKKSIQICIQHARTALITFFTMLLPWKNLHLCKRPSQVRLIKLNFLYRLTSLIIIDKVKGSLVSVLFQMYREVRDRNQTPPFFSYPIFFVPIF